MRHARQGFSYWVALALLVLGGVQTLRYASGLAASTSIPQLPSTMLWAWERPEDLRFLDTDRTGVAFLTGTVFLRGDAIHVSPRLQPLRVKPGTALMAVVRIEPDAEAPPALSASQRAHAAAAVVALAMRPEIAAVQMDYDAPASHRRFYTELLRDVRAQLPGGTALSITALASWCLSDNWLDGLPVDEAVPMLFQMGTDGGAVRQHLKQGGEFSARLCRGSLGLATNEPLSSLPRGRRVYLFHPRPWTAESAQMAAREAKP